MAAHPLRTVSPPIASPEIPSPAYVGLSIQRECPETPSPASTRPLRSPVKPLTGLRLSPLSESRIDRALLRITETGRELTSDLATSKGGSSVRDEELEAEEEKSNKKAKKRLTAAETLYQTDKRKRDTAYRNMGKWLKENLRKIGAVTDCYGILFLARDSTHKRTFHHFKRPTIIPVFRKNSSTLTLG
jgi:hypothetical protein